MQRGGANEQWFEGKNLVRTGHTPPSVRPCLDAACAEIERARKSESTAQLHRHEALALARFKP
jgi:hypothetical protein